MHPLRETTLRLANTSGCPCRIRVFHTLESHTLVFGHLKKICIFGLFQQLTSTLGAGFRKQPMRNLRAYLFGLSAIILYFQGNSQNIDAKSERNKLEMTIHFRDFLNKFEMLNLPFITSTSCYKPDSKVSRNLDNGDDSLFIKNFGGNITVGMFPDTSNFYALIYCAASECYMPILAVYTKDGIQLSEEQVSTGCGAGCGYFCSDTLVVNSMSDVNLTNIVESYNCDSLGNETKGTWKRSIDITKISIDHKGIIKMTLKHKSQTRKTGT